MDAKVIILLVFILFGMIVAYMVANGMVDLTSIFSRVTKSQAEERLGGVKLEVVSPVAGVYYQTKMTFNDGSNGEHATKFWLGDKTGGTDNTPDEDEIVDAYYIDLKDIVEITGKNLGDKMLTISVASPNWYLVENAPEHETVNSNDYYIFNYDADGTTKYVAPAKTVQLDYDSAFTDHKLANSLYLVRSTEKEPFGMAEFVELIFAIGDTAKAEVTIVAEP